MFIRVRRVLFVGELYVEAFNTNWQELSNVVIRRPFYISRTKTKNVYRVKYKKKLLSKVQHETIFLNKQYFMH